MMANSSRDWAVPHLPVTYIFGTRGLTGSPRFQIYRELEDEGVVDANQISERLFLLQSVDLEKEHS